RLGARLDLHEAVAGDDQQSAAGCFQAERRAGAFALRRAPPDLAVRGVNAVLDHHGPLDPVERLVLGGAWRLVVEVAPPQADLVAHRELAGEALLVRELQ